VSDSTTSKPSVVVTPVLSALRGQVRGQDDPPTKCERCGADMYRMHAVWRCPQCRFKTDCCGW
jgi:predicted Zn-ribbon and HTH transcriptional regulator